MAIKGLEQAVENLSRISRTAVPAAAAMAINRVASSAISQSASQVARETKVRRKLVKERARLKRATVKNPQARIKVNRGDLPVIKLGNARVVLSRRRRRKKGQRSSLKGGGSVLVVGNRRIPGAFIQQLKNGRWHVMQRVAGKNRYPIDVVKIPMAVPLTTAFKQNIERIRRERLPKELGYALQHQLRMVIKRRNILNSVQPYWMHWRSMTPGRRFLMVAPLFLMRRIFRQLPFISPALNTRAKSWTAIPGRRSCISKFSCLLRCRIQSWMRGWSPGFIR